MKRKGAKSQDQPVVKKPDAGVSTDLRSKIGAKLQTLLNNINSDSSLYIQHKRQLYADLFREPQYSEIIIDPTIVVKIEDPDSEQSDDVTYLSSENFLSSAKSRLTELLKKQQDSEKENSKECAPSSSQKSKGAMSPSSSKGKSRVSNSISDSSSAPHTDVLINQGQLQNATISIDAVCSKSGAKTTQSPTKVSQSSSPKTFFRNDLVQDIDKAVKHSHKNNFHEVGNGSELSYSKIKNIDKVPSCSTVSKKRLRKSLKKCSSEDSCSVSEISQSDVSESSKDSDIVCLSEKETVDEATVDGPEVCLTVEENMELILNDTASGDTVSCNSDEDVVLLCEKRPTYDVITLEEDDNSSDIIEEVLKCDQCGKTFRAKSLLNFHLRMHGSDSSLMSST